uniref:Uncharacterized protein n=1 Tax=Arundo donax TaxID=35708 RepID=A0A0A8Y219_ARUDO
MHLADPSLSLSQANRRRPMDSILPNHRMQEIEQNVENRIRKRMCNNEKLLGLSHSQANKIRSRHLRYASSGSNGDKQEEESIQPALAHGGAGEHDATWPNLHMIPTGGAGSWLSCLANSGDYKERKRRWNQKDRREGR